MNVQPPARGLKGGDKTEGRGKGGGGNSPKVAVKKRTEPGDKLSRREENEHGIVV